MALSAGRYVWNEPQYRRFALVPEGDVGMALFEIGLRVVNEAKLNATGRQVLGAINPEGRGPRVQTGRLRSSITLALDADAEGVFCDVGTNVEYARYLETGLRGGRRYPFLEPAARQVLGT